MFLEGVAAVNCPVAEKGRTGDMVCLPVFCFLTLQFQGKWKQDFFFPRVEAELSGAGVQINVFLALKCKHI